jgi:hypothetical protein
VIPATPDYYVVMIDHGKRGREAVVDPEQTRRDIVANIRDKQYGAVAFIQHVSQGCVADVTQELLAEAGFDLPEPGTAEERRLYHWDHESDERKHWSTL